MSIYTELKDAGCELDNHETDLYVKLCPKAIEIIRDMEPVVGRSTFMSDGELWMDIPFAYDPAWRKPA